MEQSIIAESKSIYVGDTEYLVNDEVKTEPIDDDCSSVIFKINQRKIHACVECKKTLSSLHQSLCCHEKFVLLISATPNC